MAATVETGQVAIKASTSSTATTTTTGTVVNITLEPNAIATIFGGYSYLFFFLLFHSAIRA
jgi:hypothetical protein